METIDWLKENFQYVNKYVLIICLLHLFALFSPALKDYVKFFFNEIFFYITIFVLFVLSLSIFFYFFFLLVIVLVIYYLLMKKKSTFIGNTYFALKQHTVFMHFFKYLHDYIKSFLSFASLVFFSSVFGFFLSILSGGFSSFRLSFFTAWILLILSFMVKCKLVYSQRHAEHKRSL